MPSGPFLFGLVIGWITYRTLRRTTTSSVSDIASVIGALGGASVLALFPAREPAFDQYASGLAVGFFLYLLIAWIIAAIAGDQSGVGEWLG